MKLKLLSAGDSNAKLRKSESRGVVTYGLSLAPHQTAGRGNVCPFASAGCVASCIFSAGNGAYPNVSESRIRRTHRFFDDRRQFVDDLIDDLERVTARRDRIARRTKRARKLIAVRLNMFSDLSWELIAPELFERFPDVQFYDYTKNYLRMYAFLTGRFPPNYYLTFSRSETNGRQCLETLLRGGCVTVPFRWDGLRSVDVADALPNRFWGFPVINGDQTDLRFQDAPGCVVGLKVKGTGRLDRSGFIVDVTSARELETALDALA